MKYIAFFQYKDCFFQINFSSKEIKVVVFETFFCVHWNSKRFLSYSIAEHRTIDIQTSIVCQVSIREISISIQTNRKSFGVIYWNILIVILIFLSLKVISVLFQPSSTIDWEEAGVFYSSLIMKIQELTFYLSSHAQLVSSLKFSSTFLTS